MAEASVKGVGDVAYPLGTSKGSEDRFEGIGSHLDGAISEEGRT